MSTAIAPITDMMGLPASLDTATDDAESVVDVGFASLLADAQELAAAQPSQSPIPASAQDRESAQLSAEDTEPPGDTPETTREGPAPETQAAIVSLILAGSASAAHTQPENAESVGRGLVPRRLDSVGDPAATVAMSLDATPIVGTTDVGAPTPAVTNPLASAPNEDADPLGREPVPVRDDRIADVAAGDEPSPYRTSLSTQARTGGDVQREANLAGLVLKPVGAESVGQGPVPHRHDVDGAVSAEHEPALERKPIESESQSGGGMPPSDDVPTLASAALVDLEPVARELVPHQHDGPGEPAAGDEPPPYRTARDGDGQVDVSIRKGPALAHQLAEAPLVEMAGAMSSTGTSGPTPETGLPPAASARLVDTVTAAFDSPGRAVHIQLQPETLGGLTVRVTAEDNMVRLHISAEHAATRDLIEATGPQLTQTLEAKGISVDRMVVDVAMSGALMSFSGSYDQSSRSSGGAFARGTARGRVPGPSAVRTPTRTLASVHQIDYRV